MTNAAERIRALVSGFPGDRGRLRELLMLQAYVDGSGTGDQNLLVIAGFIATSETWAEFSTEWQNKLNCAQIPYFKMVEMRNNIDVAGWFYRTLEEFDIKSSIAVVVNTRELQDVEKNIKYPPYVTKPNAATNPYYWGVRYIVGGLARYQYAIHITEPIDFIFDNEFEKEKIISSWELLKSYACGDISKLMGDTPIYRNDKNTMPLQAADLYAWWVLKWARENVTRWAEELPFPWTKKKPIQSLSMTFGRKSFLHDISKYLETLAKTHEELDYARSLMPEEWRE